MSYDLAVYVARDIEVAALTEIVEGIPDLVVEYGDQATLSLTVVRGARRRHSFTVDGPFRVEAEDVPEEVTAVILGVSHLYSVMVEGSASSDVPLAVRFARRLAQALSGVVCDQQTGELWARGTSRSAPKPRRQDRVSVVSLKWYCLTRSLDHDFARSYLALCRRSLPEALPRRFGEFEPFQHTRRRVRRPGSSINRRWILPTGTDWGNWPPGYHRNCWRQSQLTRTLFSRSGSSRPSTSRQR